MSGHGDGWKDGGRIEEGSGDFGQHFDAAGTPCLQRGEGVDGRGTIAVSSGPDPDPAFRTQG
ncbi:hypothetical protein BN940_16286 [Castellaniella defragrans 65Phen]|uniref:Uncharacterized protein n=1 Tax=Castellaniella defragrans (strain DSM 12143 / CCUG 39792 / 65Phen) TaxID=1437824 RepID=W8X5K2_CASD6|nr:hypothetical protein BN940_16286 [Castellaniella defragrans 65Phen]